MTNRKSDGQRIAEMLWDEGWLPYSDALHGDNKVATMIDAIIRKRCAKVWDEGWFQGCSNPWSFSDNPYKGRRKKDEHH